MTLKMTVDKLIVVYVQFCYIHIFIKMYLLVEGTKLLTLIVLQLLHIPDVA
jgi:hypothetical protein